MVKRKGAGGEALQRGYFTDPQSCIDARKKWRIEADQVAQFVEEMCILEAGADISSIQLYSEYQGWAKSAGIARQLNRKNFTTRIEKSGCQKVKGTGGARKIAGNPPAPGESSPAESPSIFTIFPCWAYLGQTP